MLADISGLIGLIIFVTIAIISSLVKRKQEDEFELPPELKPRRDQPPRPPRPAAREWEKQLRQLLEERPAPPPILHEVPTPPSPMRPVFRAPPTKEIEPHIEVSMPAPHARVEPTFQRLPGLTQSEARYTEAVTLQERVTQHLAEVTRRPVGSTSVIHSAASPQVREILSTIHSGEGIRRAMLASFILGPPRALEDR
jgi:hypothetical protein